jgi:hypothetical protein
MTKDRTGRELQTTSLANFKKFAQEDDGKPFFMVNLIRENQDPVYPTDWQEQKPKPYMKPRSYTHPLASHFYFKTAHMR